jgi:hypothetical protein
MDDKKDEAQQHEKAKAKGEEARKQMDEVPPPGTDPLHEGP